MAACQMFAKKIASVVFILTWVYMKEPVQGQGDEATWLPHPDHYISGSAIATFPAHAGSSQHALTVEACQQQCLGLSSCRSVVYSRLTYSYYCWLYSLSVQQARDAGLWREAQGRAVYELEMWSNGTTDSTSSGTSEELTPYIAHHGVYISSGSPSWMGSFYPSAGLTVSACREACNNRDGCRSAHYRRSDGRCELHSYSVEEAVQEGRLVNNTEYDTYEVLGRFIEKIITVPPEDFHYTDGEEEVRFRCETTGHGVDTYWEKDGARIYHEIDERMSMTATELVINLEYMNNVNVAYFYGGQYTCVANNSFYEDRSSASLLVDEIGDYEHLYNPSGRIIGHVTCGSGYEADKSWYWERSGVRIDVDADERLTRTYNTLYIDVTGLTNDEIYRRYGTFACISTSIRPKPLEDY